MRGRAAGLLDLVSVVFVGLLTSWGMAQSDSPVVQPSRGWLHETTLWEVSPFLTLHIEKDAGLFGCMAVATEVGFLTVAHCVEVGATYTLYANDDRSWPAKLVWVYGELALLWSDAPAQRLTISNIVDGELILAFTQAGEAQGTARVFTHNSSLSPSYATGATSAISATFGDSGAGVVNGGGEVVGLIAGANAFGTTVIAPLPVDLLLNHWRR